MDFLPKDPAILVSSVRSSSGRLLPTGRKNVYIHSTLDWQKDDIELAIGSYVDDMSQVIGLPLRSSKNSMRPLARCGTRNGKFIQRCNQYEVDDTI